jgi:hypothetical protein
MNIIIIIQSALTALNNTSELFLLERASAENEELNHEMDVIIVFPDWKTNTALTSGMELSKTRTYNIDFKTLDEWDNSDGSLPTAYDSKTSADRIEAMETLADSIFSYISSRNDLFPEIKAKLQWKTLNPILRANNGTMSGVSIQLTVTFAGEKICDYDQN